MKSEKGITLTALVAYVVVFSIILTIMATISSHFYANVNKIKDSHKYISEYNKFSMFFIIDVKKNTKIDTINESSLKFADGTEYKYKDEAIYRNNVKIAEYIKSFSFKQSDYTVEGVTKKIINVNTTLGDNNEQVIRNMDFILKYW